MQADKPGSVLTEVSLIIYLGHPSLIASINLPILQCERVALYRTYLVFQRVRFTWTPDITN